MNASGRYIVFASRARNLVANDDQRYTDIFLRDVQSEQTTLVSVSTNGIGSGDGDSSFASVSADGRYIIFASDAANLVPNDTNGVSDVFRRDLQLATTELVSVALSGGVAAASGGRRFLGASKPVMTSDGRYIAFESASTNFVGGDTNQSEKIFLRDMQTGTTVLASGDSQRCSSPSLSSNATRIAFVAGPLSQYVFVRDLETGLTYFAGGPVFPGEPSRSFVPVLAPDGRFVVFKAVPGAGSPVHVIQGNVGSGPGSVLATNSHLSTAPSLSRDGRWLAFEENGHVYLRDLESETNILISTSGALVPPARGTSHTPVVSGDGGHVAFVSSATDLVPGTTIGTTNTFHLYVRNVSAGITRLVTVTTNGRPAPISAATQPLISHDGTRVAFDTDVATLVAGDNNNAYDVFLRNMESGATALISAAHPQRRAVTGIRSATLKPNSVSADGTRVAFAMPDTDLITSDTNRNLDVFVHDLSSGVIPQSTDSNGVFLTTRRAVNPFLSAGGEHILFETWEPASELYSGRGRLFWKPVASATAIELSADVSLLYPAEWGAAINSNGTLVVAWNYLHDMVARTSRPLPGGALRRPLFSPNEEWVVGKGSPASSMYAVHLRTNKTVSVSKDQNGRPLAAQSGAFNGSGRYFVFDSVSGVTNEVYRYDFESDSTQLISTNGTEPAIDFTGNLIAFSSAPIPATALGQIYVRDVTAGRTDLITRNAFGTGAANGDSRAPLVSGDGRYVVFVSRANDLVLNDSNNTDDIFVHDRVQRSTVVLTRSRQTEDSANALSSVPVLAADGRTVVFQSFASDLIDGDYNEERDIFVLKLGAGDSDNDGMDDDWEVAYFGDLSRDGAGDRDSDGQTDLQEFLAGTDPTNGGSILRVLTVVPIVGGSTTIVWSAVVGRNYVVQFKDSLETDWANASSVIEADSTSMFFMHNSSSHQRYYRVITIN